MARIRSIHPGLFTDPEFADLSESAQVFYLGLLTEADDNGIFEWKPTTLRIRLRPTKDGGVDHLLSELVHAKKVASYEHEGRKYGAIRNFCQWQRPKSPKSWFFIPGDFRNYVGSKRLPSEKPPQREEEGGSREAPPGPPPDEYQKSSPVAAREDGPAGADAHDIKSILSELGTRKRA